MSEEEGEGMLLAAVGALLCRTSGMVRRELRWALMGRTMLLLRRSTGFSPEVSSCHTCHSTIIHTDETSQSKAPPHSQRPITRRRPSGRPLHTSTALSGPSTSRTTASYDASCSSSPLRSCPPPSWPYRWPAAAHRSTCGWPPAAPPSSPSTAACITAPRLVRRQD